MKKQKNGFILGVLSTLLVIGLVGTAVAATQYRQLNAAYNGIKITLDGVQVPLKDGAGNSVEPFIVDGTTYLPVRAVASALGLNVDWDGATSTVILRSKVVDPAPDSSGFVESDVSALLDVTPYQWASSYYSYLGLEVKNNSPYCIDISCNATFYNNKNEMIGSGKDSIRAIPSGGTILLKVANDDAFSSFKYDFDVSLCESYVPVTQNVSLEHNVLPEKVVLSATNNGQTDARFLEVTALFFKNGTPVYHGSTYLVDDDSELKSGKSRSSEIDCSKEFDSVKLYLTGRGEK